MRRHLLAILTGLTLLLGACAPPGGQEAEEADPTPTPASTPRSDSTPAPQETPYDY